MTQVKKKQVKDKKRETYYFTFGMGQRHENCFHKIKATSYDKAREIMVSRYGKMWAFQYEKKGWFDKDGISQQEKYNLKEIK